MIQLRGVTIDNFDQCVALSIHEAQRDFVYSIPYLIALSKVEPHWQPYGVYDADVLVGFCLYGKTALDAALGAYSIHTLIIDQRFQNKGYGRAVIQHLVAQLCTLADCRIIKLSHAPDNFIAGRLYASLGFVYIDEYWYTNEQVMCYTCPQ